MIDYSPLWNTLRSKGISQYLLVRSYHFSSGQLHRIRKNEHVSTFSFSSRSVSEKRFPQSVSFCL